MYWCVQNITHCADVTVVVAANGTCLSAGEMNRTGSMDGRHTVAQLVGTAQCAQQLATQSTFQTASPTSVLLQLSILSAACRCGCKTLQNAGKYQQQNVTTSNSVQTGKTVLIETGIIRNVE